MIDVHYFLDSVLPQLPQAQREAFFATYPQIYFAPQADSQPLMTLPVLMLVALTGTGKSTTLNALATRREAGELAYGDQLPSRREIADFIVIPTAQTLLGEHIQPVSDRVRRFFYTRNFAQYFSGGIAQAFAWLHYAGHTGETIISEGVRGEAEIRFALENCPRWQVVELAVNPITRLKRLSSRDDKFDHATGSADVDFLPEALQAVALQALNAGGISPQALTILRAEAENYDLAPVQLDHARYRYLQTDNLTPEAVAEQVALIVKEMVNYA
ncbi:MAG: hypothetical protein RLP44_32445 [Aggregatilineales bacterium]